MSAIPTALRAAVDALWRGRCARCGGRRDHHHHRQRRRDGGHTLSNVVPLCAACHAWVHGHPTQARALGWIVSFAGEPASVPVSSCYGWRLITPAGLVVATPRVDPVGNV